VNRTILSILDYPANFKASWASIWVISIGLVIGLVAAQLPLQLALILLGGTGILILIVIQPLVGLTLTLIAGSLGAQENLIFGNAWLESGQIFFLITVIAWLGRAMIHRTILIRRTSLNMPLLAFITVASLSLLTTQSMSLGVKELGKWLEMGLAMLLVVDLTTTAYKNQEIHSNGLVRSIKQISYRWIVAMLLVAGLTQAFIGIWQFLRGDGPDHFAIFGNFFRAYGTFMQPNPYGGFMAINASLAIGSFTGLLLALYLNIRQGIKIPKREWLWIVFLAICFFASLFALIFSWSRGAWLGFAGAMAVLILFLPRKRWLGILMLFVAISVFLYGSEFQLIPSTISGRLSNFGQDLQLGDVRGVDINDENYAVIERIAHWQAAVDMAKDNIWMGVGFGNYEAAYPEYALLNWPFPLGHAHNYYLNILAETGVFGAVVYLFFWIVVFVQATLLLRHTDWQKRGIILGLLAAWTAIAVHQAVDKLYVNNLFIFMGVMLGLQQVIACDHD
jgi:O-antigen ligase